MANTVPYSGTRRFDDILSAITDEVVKAQPVNQGYESNAVLSMLDRNYKLMINAGGFWTGNVKNVDSGESAQVVEKGRPLDTHDTTTNTRFEYKRVYLARQVVLYHTDVEDTTTPEALYDLVQDKTDTGFEIIDRTAASQLWAATQGTDGGFNEITGIPLHIEETPISSGALGGLTGSAALQPWWRNQAIDAGGANASNILLKKIDAMDKLLAFGGHRKWKFACVSKETHTILVQQARTYNVLQLNPKSKAGRRIADLGYDVVEHNNKPIIWDRKCVEGQMFFFSEGALELGVMRGNERKLGPWARLEGGGQLGRIAYITWCLNLITSERRALGVIYNFVEA